MLPTSENTGNVVLTGSWQVIAGEGDVVISCPTPYERAIGTAQPSEDVIGHPETRTDLRLSGSQKVYVKGKAGMKVAVTAVTVLAS